jgi:phosphatidylinositol-3-phosphatase
MHLVQTGSRASSKSFPMKWIAAFTLAFAASACASSGDEALAQSDDALGATAIKKVYLVMMENHDWSTLQGSASAPYINNTLLPLSAHAEAYFTANRLHPSEPNYLWLEAGDNLSVTDDKGPAINGQATTAHFSHQLDAKGVSWRVYAEGISGIGCPQTNDGKFVVRHVPQVYFDDVTSDVATCEKHIRPYKELAGDLAAGKTASYNFIVPDLCHDMHGHPTCTSGLVQIGDTWLKQALPAIYNSRTFSQNSVLFVVFDEGKSGSQAPIPFIAMGKNGKKGFASAIRMDHSSTLKTLETIFGVPHLRGAKTSNDLRSLFSTF